MISWILIAVAFIIGLLLQRTSRAAVLRDGLWTVNFWAVLPAIVFATFLTATFDRTLVVAIGAAIAGSWLLLLVSYLYARVVSRERDEIGALTLGAAFGNTAFIGYPLAQLLFGPAGLKLAVIYDQLCFGVPMTSVSPVVARTHGRRPATAPRPLLSAIVRNPPLWGMLLGLAARLTGLDLPVAASIEQVAAAIVGPLGFLMLGLALPLEAIEHEGHEVAKAAGSIGLRILGGPLMLFAIGRAMGAEIPPTFYLIAATPAAFHVLVLARIYDLRPALMRLQIVASTVLMVVGSVVLAKIGGSI